jgi:DNA polymerase-1
MYLIECSYLIYRSYFVAPNKARYPDGLPTGAVEGCCDYFWRLAKERPTHAAIVFDSPARCAKRLAVNPTYKAQRPPVHPDLSVQFPFVRRAAAAFGFALVEQNAVEADDLIATYARIAEAAGREVTIVSADKDFYQLIRPGVSLYNPMPPGRAIGPEQVMEKFGVSPAFMVDLQALTGDTADNIKGIEKVGPKNAAKLLCEYGSLENVLRNGHNVKDAKGNISAVGRNIIRDADLARAAKLQVKLDDSVPVEVPIDSFAYAGFDIRTLTEFLDEMDLGTLRDDIKASMMEVA